MAYSKEIVVEALMLSPNRGFELHEAKRMVELYYEDTPVVEDLDGKILEQILTKPATFDMSLYHARWEPDGRDSEYLQKVTSPTCGTVHCLAGWAVVLAGAEGLSLHEQLAEEDAGALIFAKSTGSVPWFFNNTGSAIREVKERVKNANARKGL